MTVTDHIGYGLVVLGMTYGVVQSALLAPIRVSVARWGAWWRTFVYCPFCVGFWVALNVSYWHQLQQDHLLYAFGWVGALLLARAVWPALFDGSTHALESAFIDEAAQALDEDDDDPDDDEPADAPDPADAANEEDHERTRKAA